jgi:NADPH:quinone reductase-like Zn-dependent oxidoreductase
MRAVAVEKLKGEPRLMDLPQPVAKADQLLVKVSAAGINPIDWKLADGMLDGVMPNVLPFVLGVDAAGVVAGIGAHVSRFKKGDRVFGQFLHAPLGEGTYAEYTVVPETAAVAKLPSAVSNEIGAALPTAAMTALAMVDLLELAPGSKVLIVGATGGVGSFATQIAAAKGFTVLVTTGAQDVGRMKQFGAYETYDYRAADLISQISAAHKQGIDALIDVVSDAAAFKKNAGLVSKGGFALTTVGVADQKDLQTTGIKGGNFSLQADAGLLQRLAVLVESGELMVPIEATISLAEASAAIAASRSGRARGKTVIRIG